MNSSIAQPSISSPIQHYLEELHREYAQVDDGTVYRVRILSLKRV
jgi:hypothetical protein